jgi:PhnB protein
MQINAYLHFNGNCEEAFKFYETLIGGKIGGLMTYDGAPMDTPAHWRSKIMHASMTVGNALLMGADSMPHHYQPPAGFSVSISVDSAAEAERIFAGLAEGGNVTMPLQQTFWAIRFGMVTDRFGIPWMINCETAH